MRVDATYTLAAFSTSDHFTVTNMSSLARRLNANLDLTSKLAVLVGGSQGIGAGVAVRFAQVSLSRVSMFERIIHLTIPAGWVQRHHRRKE